MKIFFLFFKFFSLSLSRNVRQPLSIAQSINVWSIIETFAVINRWKEDAFNIAKIAEKTLRTSIHYSGGAGICSTTTTTIRMCTIGNTFFNPLLSSIRFQNKGPHIAAERETQNHLFKLTIGFQRAICVCVNESNGFASHRQKWVEKNCVQIEWKFSSNWWVVTLRRYFLL